MTVLAWSTGGLSVAGFVAAWTLAAYNRDLSDLSDQFGPDRFMIAYAVAGTVLASRLRSNPVGWIMLGIGLLVSALTPSPTQKARVWTLTMTASPLPVMLAPGTLQSLGRQDPRPGPLPPAHPPQQRICWRMGVAFRRRLWSRLHFHQRAPWLDWPSNG